MKTVIIELQKRSRPARWMKIFIFILMFPIMAVLGVIIKTTGLTALGDTTKTLIGDVKVPENVTVLKAASGYACGGPGLTTLENISGIMTLESEDFAMQPQIIPLDPIIVVGTGVSQVEPKVWPIGVTVEAGSDIHCSMTLDLAQTLANTGRITLIFE